MKNDLITKIRKTVSKNVNLEETDVRSLMILVRKFMELMPPSNHHSFLILRLFSNWAVHTQITKSNTGLKILSAINDALVTLKSADTNTIQTRISHEIGFSALRREMKLFFGNIDVDDTLVSDNYVWAVFITHLIEIIRDVPLSFPHISALDETKRKIYDHISRNPIKPGAGVVSIKISQVNYSAIGAKAIDNTMCLFIKTEDKTTIVVPLLIDVRI